MMRSGPFIALRFLTLICALTLGCLSLWTVVPNALTVRLPEFPSSGAEAERLYDARSRTSVAALIGVLRGDIGTMAAIAEASPYLFESDGAKRAAFPQPSVDLARLMAIRAAKLSPHDSRNWLVLAATADLTGSTVSVVDALKLSYYTGPGDLALAPLRLAAATRSPAIADDELRTFVSLETRQFVTKQPTLKTALASIYANANEDGRKVLEAALAPTDAPLLNAIKRP